MVYWLRDPERHDELLNRSRTFASGTFVRRRLSNVIILWSDVIRRTLSSTRPVCETETVMASPGFLPAAMTSRQTGRMLRASNERMRRRAPDSNRANVSSAVRKPSLVRTRVSGAMQVIPPRAVRIALAVTMP